MSKNTYNKNRIEIAHWFVTKNNLSLIYDFFIERFDLNKFKIEIETKDGHSRACEDYDEFIKTIDHLLKKREVIKEISIIHREENTDVDSFKMIWVIIPFKGNFHKPNLNIIAGDNDGSCADWVEATFNGAKKLQELLTESDEVAIEYLNKNELAAVLDLDESFKEKKLVKAKEQEDKKVPNISIVAGTITNYGQIGGEANHQDIIGKKETDLRFYETWWFKYIIFPLSASAIATLIGLNG